MGGLLWGGGGGGGGDKGYVGHPPKLLGDLPLPPPPRPPLNTPVYNNVYFFVMVTAIPRAGIGIIQVALK